MNINQAGAAYTEVKIFNTVAGNLSVVTDDSIDNQISFIFEELQETITAFEAGDKVGVLDGACDLFVTVSGLMQKLEKARYNVAEAVKRVNANNLSKFPEEVTDEDKAQYTVTFNEQYNRYVLKDGNGKVRKPSTFKPVDLSDLIPKE